MTSLDLQNDGFSGQILTSQSSGFEEASRRFSALSESTARYIVFPKSTQDVAIAIQFSQKAKLGLAIRCGGNHPSSSSSVEDGIIIDLKELNTVTLNNDTDSITVGGGARWADVYGLLKGTGRICIGGGVWLVGVGGHLTGGGWGPLSHKYGVASDNIISATVVLADGQAVCASKIENPDLFWAIKGGSSNFGVVTEFVLKTYPDPGTFFTHPLVFPGEALPHLVPAIEEFVNSPKKADEYILLFIFLARTAAPEHLPFVVLNFVGIAPHDRYAERINAFRQLAEPMSDTLTLYEDFDTLSHSMDSLLQGGPRRVISVMPLVTGLWPNLTQAVYDKWLQYTNSDPDAVGSMVGIECHAASRLSPEDSCYPVSVPVHHAIMTTAAHHNTSTDEKASAWLRDSANLVQKFQRENGTNLPLAVNGTSIPAKPEEIWGESYPRLRKLKAKYDPKAVFNRLHPIEPDFSTPVES